MTTRHILAPEGNRWRIYDRHLRAFCSLPDERGEMVPLRWRTQEGAARWLTASQRQWARWMKENAEAVPEDWTCYPPLRSPWSNYITPLNAHGPLTWP